MTNEKITLNLSETNELILKVSIKGSSKEPSSIRLVFENAEQAYVIKGQPHEGDMHRFSVPNMESKGFNEGVYSALVEVIVDGRYFVPIQFDADFVRPLTVHVETVQQVQQTTSNHTQDIQVNAEVKKTTQVKHHVAVQEKQNLKQNQKQVNVVRPIIRAPAIVAEHANAQKSGERIKMSVKDLKKLVAESIDVDDDEFSAKEQAIIDSVFRRKR